MLHCEMCDVIEKTQLVVVGSSTLLGEGRVENTLITIDLLIFHWILCIYNAANTNMNMKLSAAKMFLCVMKKTYSNPNLQSALIAKFYAP